MSPTPVPKPSNPGERKTAIANTRAGYVNVRTGPGVDYDDIGDILNGTQVNYYPATNSSDWVWVEQYSTAGWVYGGVVEFAEVTPYPKPDYPATPYDGKIALWHWKGQGLPERTIDELARNIRQYAPNVKQIWVKCGDGGVWQGNYDSGDMAINGPSDIGRWVTTLGQYGLEFHAWFVMKGEDVDAEADLLIQTGQRSGVKSIILDIEPFQGYWRAGPEPIRPLMTRVRQALGTGVHIGFAVDSRQSHYANVYPDEWLPFVDSVHPMCYWKSFRRDVEQVMEEAYVTWGDFGKPIIPILQGDAELEEQRQAHSIVTQRYWAKSISWWRYGVIAIWAGVNMLPNAQDESPTDPTETPPPGTQFGEEKIVFAGQDGYRSGTYTGQQEFTRFTGSFGWDAFYTTTHPTTSKVWAEWKTNLPESGIYQISVFIPARHATTSRARYKIHGIRGTNTEVVVDIKQTNHRNEWVPLGVFDLVKGQTNAGKVFLNDVTGESGKEIAFDAVRFRRIIEVGDGPDVVDGVNVADGYDSPVGTAVERSSDDLWPDGWRDASPFGQLYFAGTWREAYHTGADLNYGAPTEDRGMPAYATASGIVTFAAQLKVWGNVIVIKHDPLRSPTGRVFYSRYGHVQNMLVKAGDRVKRGDQIAEIGDAFGTLVPHLHFDLSPTTKLEANPADWPGKDYSRIVKDYIDPLLFIRSNRPGS